MSGSRAAVGTTPPAPATGPVRVVDLPLQRVRRPSDLVLMVTSVVGIAAVLVLGVYASRTTTGVIDDIEASPLQRVIDVVSSILLLPVNVIEGWLTLILPIVVIAERLIRRNPRAVLEALGAAIVAAVLAVVLSWLILDHAPVVLVDELQVWQVALDGSGQWVMTITPTVAALSALLTATGTRDRSRIIAISWNLLWIVLVVAVITSTSTIVGALVSVLIGRAVGLGGRYLFGVLSERVHGDALVTAIRRSGIDPVSVIRLGGASAVEHMRVETVVTPAVVGYTTADTRPDPLEPDVVTAPIPRVQRLPAAAQPAGAEADPPAGTEPMTDTAFRGIAAVMPESATVAIEREGLNRIYAVLDRDGQRWDAVVLDRDRQVIGLLAWLWSAIRFRGFGRRNAVSLRQAADRAVLMTYAASAAGVNNPRLRGIARSDDSILLLGEHVEGAQNLSDYTIEAVTDEVMAQAWEQLGRAHAAGLSHRNLSAETVLLVGEGPEAGDVYINGWEQGDIASSSLSRRIDEIQMLMLFAVRVGADRACAAAAQALGTDHLAALAPLLQGVALPPETQAEARKDKTVMRDVRNKLVTYLPASESEVQPIQLTRFRPRTIVTIVVAVAAGWVLLTAVNFREILTYAANANPMWMLAAFGLGLITYLGSAMGLVAFSPEKLGLWRTTLVQVAASVIGIVAPAGVGPAALNLRFMTKRGVETPLAVATVALLQVSQFVTTVLMLIAIALLTGSQGALASLPSGTIVIILVIAIVISGVLFAIPKLRRFLIAKSRPTLRQVMPRLIWVLGQPSRLLMGIGGNVIMTAGYLAAFAATLAAFGQSLPLTTLAVIYLTGTAIGSAVPTPGGMGGVETALTAGLRTAGIGTAAALPTVLIFRVLTLYIRVPLGWVALRHLQKQNAV
ncbi:lysylphosphatidylglycerol synthase transmembrane domain-containing protein [Pseudactinotalea suaedae]|uniref:lysylphosphatidylglycerol synthase transmembrane domain-containing protein n=1 Tax=Pseudactinotalea suaedae TaxID=1524924 RepID=UPI0012E210AC|nr:lysylphosphatidylglycerol synthase transmembrane domain-containing protein [Pseudactinotalea suaedae]